MTEYTVTSSEHLKEIAEERHKSECPGPIFLELSTLRTMEHSPLLAAAIFNPFGPTVETISIASFEGRWDGDSTVIVRRSLHPFCENRIQVLANIPLSATQTMVESLENVLTLFIANNGRTVQSAEWAQPFFETLPSGIIISGPAVYLASRIRLAFRYMLRQMEDSLVSNTLRLKQAGPDYWSLATLELQEAFKGLSVDCKEAQHVQHDLSRMLPEIVQSIDPEKLPPSDAFDQWWDIVSSREYQSALYRDLPPAWSGATEQVPGLADPRIDCSEGDFLSWWKLFMEEF